MADIVIDDPFEVADPQPHNAVGPVFTAAFDSECADCDDYISEGDNARYVNGGVCCSDCWPEGYEDE